MLYCSEHIKGWLQKFTRQFSEHEKHQRCCQTNWCLLHIMWYLLPNLIQSFYAWESTMPHKQLQTWIWTDQTFHISHIRSVKDLHNYEMAQDISDPTVYCLFQQQLMGENYLQYLKKHILLIIIGSLHLQLAFFLYPT